MKPNIIREALDFEDLYLKDVLTEMDVLEFVWNKFENDGRIGITKKQDIASVYDLQKHASELFSYLKEKEQKGTLRDEWAFISEFLNSPELENVIEKSMEDAKKVFPNEKFCREKIIFTVDTKFPSGVHHKHAEINGNTVTVNLTTYLNISGIFESMLNGEGEGISPVMKHELTHSYLNQVNHDMLLNDIRDLGLKDAAEQVFFDEGLSTFAEAEHLPQHYEYMAEIEFWIELAHRAINAKTESEKISAVETAANNRTLRKYNPAVIKIAERLKENFSEKAYRNALGSIYYINNGPAYHIGYHIWDSIDKFYGRNKVKNLTTRAPAEFIKAYERIGLFSQFLN